MSSNFLVCSYNNGESAKALAAALGCRLVSHTTSGPTPRGKTIINLGCNREHPAMQRVLMIGEHSIYNNPDRVNTSQSKMSTFAALGSRLCVPFNTSRDIVLYNVGVLGQDWVARTLDRGSSGEGIVMVTPASLMESKSIPVAKVYTKAINKRREYRVHVGHVDGRYRVIDVTRKIRRPGVDDDNRPFIWNHSNDFIFVRGGVTGDTIPNSLLSRALDAVSGLNLHFGAVDIVVERGGTLREANCYVLEVNTSPGMEGRTLERYVNFFQARIGTARFVQWEHTVESEETEPQNDGS